MCWESSLQVLESANNTWDAHSCLSEPWDIPITPKPLTPWLEKPRGYKALVWAVGWWCAMRPSPGGPSVPWSSRTGPHVPQRCRSLALFLQEKGFAACYPVELIHTGSLALDLTRSLTG